MKFVIQCLSVSDDNRTPDLRSCNVHCSLSWLWEAQEQAVCTEYCEIVAVGALAGASSALDWSNIVQQVAPINILLVFGL